MSNEHYRAFTSCALLVAECNELDQTDRPAFTAVQQYGDELIGAGWSRVEALREALTWQRSAARVTG